MGEVVRRDGVMNMPMSAEGSNFGGMGNCKVCSSSDFLNFQSLLDGDQHTKTARLKTAFDVDLRPPSVYHRLLWKLKILALALAITVSFSHTFDLDIYVRISGCMD